MIKRLLNRSDFIKNSATLVSGIILAQVIPIILSPYLRRVFSEDEFTLYEAYFVCISLLVPIANLKYEQTVVIPKDDKEGSELVFGSITMCFIVSLITFIGVFFGADYIIEKMNWPLPFKPWLFLVPVVVFIASTSRALNAWLIRKKAFRASSVNKVSRRAGEGAAQIGISFTKMSGGFILAIMIGETVNFFVSFFQAIKHGLLRAKPTVAGIKSQLKRYKEFPIYSTLPTLLNVASLQLPMIFIFMLYTKEDVAQFGLSRQMLSIPIALISAAILQVLTQKIAESRHKSESIYELVMKIAKSLGLIGLIGVLLLVFIGPWFFCFVWGDTWSDAGLMAQILAVSFAIKFVVNPLSAVFAPLERIRVMSTWQTIYFVLIGSLYFIPDLDIMEFLIAFAIIDAIAYAIYFMLILKVCKDYDNSLVHE